MRTSWEDSYWCWEERTVVNFEMHDPNIALRGLSSSHHGG